MCGMKSKHEEKKKKTPEAAVKIILEKFIMLCNSYNDGTKNKKSQTLFQDKKCDKNVESEC